MNSCIFCKNKFEVIIKLKNKRNKEKSLKICKACFEKYYLFVRKDKNNGKCPKCGYTLDEFKEFKFLGCDYCYIHFSNYVIKYLKKIHTNLIYKGKYPEKFEKLKRNRKYFDLKDYLIESIEYGRN